MPGNLALACKTSGVKRGVKLHGSGVFLNQILQFKGSSAIALEFKATMLNHQDPLGDKCYKKNCRMALSQIVPKSSAREFMNLDQTLTPDQDDIQHQSQKVNNFVCTPQSKEPFTLHTSRFTFSNLQQQMKLIFIHFITSLGIHTARFSSAARWSSVKLDSACSTVILFHLRAEGIY